MVDFNEISKKWQGKWEKAKIFEANPDKRKKKCGYCRGMKKIRV